MTTLQAGIDLWDMCSHATCFKMADKTTTSLTSHLLFPSSGDGLDLDQPFAFAPALVPTSAAPVLQPSGINTTQEIDLNPGVCLFDYFITFNYFMMFC